ncbi:MAG: hypothetical protein ACRCYY_09690 [Trueperaceae bacterium]
MSLCHGVYELQLGAFEGEVDHKLCFRFVSSKVTSDKAISLHGLPVKGKGFVDTATSGQIDVQPTLNLDSQ